VDNVTRLRHHPCIVAWNGNNEDYLFAELFKTNYDIKDTDPGNWLKSTFPSRYIYEVVLPDLCRKLIPDASYHPGSPWGGESFNDSTVGDTHRWEGMSQFFFCNKRHIYAFLMPCTGYQSRSNPFVTLSLALPASLAEL
jgi:beta-galactosidase/beta-glucuronidase